MRLLKHIALAWMQYRAFQAALAGLQSLSDRELSDLGLARSDIARVAYAEAERRTAAAFAPSRPEARAGSGGEEPVASLG